MVRVDHPDESDIPRLVGCLLFCVILLILMTLQDMTQIAHQRIQNVKSKLQKITIGPIISND